MFQHRRRFFRRRAGLLSGAHFLPERGGVGWNPQHSFLQAVLLSAAQFAGQALLYRLLSCTQFRGAGVGIPRTVYGGRGCYRQHNFGAVCIAGQKKWLLSGAQFGLFSEGGRLLFTAQFARWVKFGYCYRQHISEFRLLSKRVRTGLLSSAHFRQWGCYRAHSFQTVEFWRLLLSTAHFGKNPPYSAQPVLLFTAQFVFSGAERLLSGAQFAKIRFFAARSAVGCSSAHSLPCRGRGCYRRHNTRIFQHGLLFSAHFPAAGFFHPPCWNAAHISHFSFFRARGCYTRHFLKIPQNFLCRHFPAKKLFYRCYAPHIVALYTFVLECCAQHRCNTAHIYIGIFDIAILLF